MKMKKSRYNVCYKDDENYFIFNSLSNTFVKLNKEEYLFYKRLDNKNINVEDISQEYREFFNQLKNATLISNDKLNELNYLKTKYNSARIDNNNLELIIAPTLKCNLKCSYCYQKGNIKASFEEGVIKKIEKLVEFYANKDTNFLKITWYGGEPLLTIDQITELSSLILSICEEKDIKYQSNMVTNGYLLSEDVTNKLLKSKITNLQITLDGPKEIHNARRKKLNGDGTYNKILENIEENCERIGINIRVNIDKENKEYLKELMLDLKERELHRKVGINIAPVLSADTSTCSSITNSCFNISSFSKFKVKFLNMCLDMGFKTKALPKLSSMSCGALTKNQFVITGNGDLYKCLESVGREEEKIGELGSDDELIKINSRIYDWLGYSPFNNEECVQCKLLPICLGGCPHEIIIKDKEPRCSQFKYNLEEVLNIYRKTK